MNRNDKIRSASAPGNGHPIKGTGVIFVIPFRCMCSVVPHVCVCVCVLVQILLPGALLGPCSNFANVAEPIRL